MTREVGSARRSRTILHVTAPARFGGLESVVSALAAGQRGRGDRVLVAAVLEPGGAASHPFLAELEGSGVETAAIEVPGRAYGRERAAIRSLLDDFRPDVVHTHGFRTDVVDAPVARARGVPSVTTVHGFTGGGWKARLYEWMQVRAHRRFDAVVAVSERLRDELSAGGVPVERVHLHPNAWTPGAMLLSREDALAKLSVRGPVERDSPPSESLRIGWVGRLGEEKAPDLFLEALEAIESIDWTASIVGDGPLGPELRTRSDELGLTHRVDWHGSVPGAGALMRAFDVLVLSSRTEGTPIVLLEAMAAGLPIVATRVGGVPALMGEAALLCEPGSVESLASAIRRMAEDRELRARLGAAGRDRLKERGDQEAWLDGYERIYDAAAGG